MRLRIALSYLKKGYCKKNRFDSSVNKNDHILPPSYSLQKSIENKNEFS